MRRCLFTFFAFVLLAQPSWAGCGLEDCSCVAEEPKPAEVRLTGSVEVRQTSFNYLGIPGNYSECNSRVELRDTALRLGAILPVISLHFIDETVTGLGSPLFYAEVDLGQHAGQSLDLGLQLESPWGDVEKGLAEDHSMFVPYVRNAFRIGTMNATVTAGYRAVIVDDEEAPEDASATRSMSLARGRWGEAPSALQLHAGHDSSQLNLVNPHEHHEVLWRAQVTTSPVYRNIRVGTLLDAQHVVDGSSDETFFLNGGGWFFPAVRSDSPSRHQLLGSADVGGEIRLANDAGDSPDLESARLC